MGCCLVDVGGAVSRAMNLKILGHAEDYSEEEYIALLEAVNNLGSCEHARSPVS